MTAGEGGDLAGRVARLAAVQEIRQLAARYARALDARDLDGLMALFAPDVRLGGGRSGRAELRRDVLPDLVRLGLTILHVGNHVVDLEGPDDATGSVYCRAEVRTAPGTLVVQDIHYGDRYVRQGGRWYFVRRRHELFHGVELGRRPLGLAPADWPANDVGSGTLPQRWPSWQAFRDRPGAVGG